MYQFSINSFIHTFIHFLSAYYVQNSMRSSGNISMISVFVEYVSKWEQILTNNYIIT